MGGFIEYDETDSLCLDSFMRIKVNVDVDKPLRRGFKIATMQNWTKWVDIKYERLGDFCFYCGRIGHIDRDCSFIEEDEEMRKSLVYKYGPWLKASPLRRNKLPKQEYEKEKNLLSKLYVQAAKKENKVTGLEVKRLGPPSMARKALFQNSGGHNQVASRGKENTVESSGDSSSWCNIGEEDEGVGELNKEMQKIAVGKAPKWRRRTRSLGRKESVASPMVGGRVNMYKKREEFRRNGVLVERY
ncbi:Retrotransposon Gag-like protein 3 [Bienertia sinuspersici]